MDVDPGYKHFENFCVGFQGYMMQSMDVISSTSFNIKSENNELVSFNGQSISFTLSIKQI